MIEQSFRSSEQADKRLLHKQFLYVGSQQDNALLKKTLKGFSFLGTMFHLCFIFLFATMGLFTLSAVNVISVGVWLLTLLLIKKAWYSTTLVVMIVEIVAHATIATVMLGAQAGFHFYLWPAMGILFASPMKHKNLFSLFHLPIIGLFIYLNYAQPGQQSVQSFDSLMVVLFSLNVILSAAPFVYAITYFQKSGFANNKKLFELANTDDFTHVYNRRFIYDLMRENTHFSKAGQFDDYAVVLISIDHFGSLNSQYGHDVGDQILLTMTSVIRRHVREQDVVARWGGKEFLILLSRPSDDDINNIVESIRFGMFNESKPADTEHELTFSYGIGKSSKDQDFVSVLQQADRQLHS